MPGGADSTARRIPVVQDPARTLRLHGTRPV